MLEQHYSPEEVAAKVGVSIDTVYRACRRGDLHSVKPAGGAARRIPESAVDAWLNGSDHGSTLAAPVLELSSRRR